MRLILIFCLSGFLALAATDIAQVIKVRGSVSIKGKKSLLKVGDWLEQGASIRSARASFARLRFIDDTKLNIGPNSQMLIKQFANDKAGILHMVKGRMRAQVSKDYLKIKQGQSKLFVTSKNAVMGVRGTEFIFDVGPDTTQAILLEGDVAFNSTTAQVENSKLENIVSRGVILKEGYESRVRHSDLKPSGPQKIDSLRFQQLKLSSLEPTKHASLEYIKPAKVGETKLDNQVAPTTRGRARLPAQSTTKKIQPAGSLERPAANSGIRGVAPSSGILQRRLRGGRLRIRVNE